jgi:hypothetical protein
MFMENSRERKRKTPLEETFVAICNKRQVGGIAWRDIPSIGAPLKTALQAVHVSERKYVIGLYINTDRTQATLYVFNTDAVLECSKENLIATLQQDEEGGLKLSRAESIDDEAKQFVSTIDILYRQQTSGEKVTATKSFLTGRSQKRDSIVF